MNRSRLFGLLVITVLLLGGSAALAQVPTGSIAGTVIDSTGAAIPGAEVAIINEGTGARHKLTTSSTGSFLVPSLQAGLYTVEVTASGFMTAARTGIKLNAGTQYSVPPIQLEVGAVTETITVEAGAELVNTINAVVSNIVEPRQITELPLLNRNPLALLDLQAGVTGTVIRAGGDRVVNGLRTSLTNVTMDGINIQDNFIRTGSNSFLPTLPLISQVSEFNLINSNATPDAGFGAIQVTMTTPSGTNEWHGDVFWYHRNNKVAANDWFNNASGTEKPKLIQNQGGFGIGGPVAKDKLFVYGYYELFRSSQQNSDVETVLTSNARQGLFSYATLNAIDTSTNPLGAFSSCASTATVIPGGTICTLDVLGLNGFSVDPFVAGLLADVPTGFNDFSLGDSSASQLLNTAGFRFNQRSNRTRDNYGFKLDWVPSPEHVISGTWSWNRDIVDRPSIDNTFSETPVILNDNDIKFLSTAYRWSPSGNLTNEFRGGFTLAPATFTNTDADQFGSFVITDSASDSGQTAGGATFIFSNPIEDFRPQGRFTDTWSLQDNVNYTLGNHNMRFGFFFQRIVTEPFSGFNIPGSFDIGTGTGNPSLTSADFPGGADSTSRSNANLLMASLAGLVFNAQADFNVDPANAASGFVPNQLNQRSYDQNNYAFYWNDSWRVRPSFTFNFGVRWDYFSVFDEKNSLFLTPVLSEQSRAGLLATFANPDPTQIMIDFSGDRAGRRPYDRDYNNFAPQVGFAWDVFGDGKTSIRAGYSINFTMDEFFTSSINSTQMDGLSATQTLQNTTGSISGTQPGLPGLPTFTAPTFQVPRSLQDNINDFAGGVPDTLFTIDPDFKTPYVQQWNLSIQRDVGRDTVVEVRYVGNRAVHLPRAIDFNQVVIFGTGYFQDFLAARNNGFLAEAATGSFNPAFDSSISGSQALPFFDNNFFGGFLFLGFIQDMVREGRAGELASLYHFNAIGSNVVARINPNASVADALLNWSTSNYHAGIVEVRRRPTRGLSFQANYTFSKVLTDSSGCRGNDCNDSQSRFDPLLDLDNPGLEYARAEYDITHAFKTNFLYDIPLGRGQALSAGNWLDKVVGGWTLGSIFTWQSGAPFSIHSNRGTLNRNGRSNNRNTASSLLTAGAIEDILGVNRTSDGVSFVPGTAVNTANGTGVADDSLNPCNAFGPMQLCHPAPGTVGNLPRNAFNGPTFFNWDLSIIKRTEITERVGVEFRAEFFNFTNTPVFFVSDIDLDDGSFGSISDTINERRRVQFGLRVTF